VNLSPVIGRELIAQSRQPATYWLRVAGAAGVMTVFALAASGPSRSGRELGEYLFDALNAAAYHVILLCVPLLTADSISRERREGTLGLLFLTPLRARDIVAGKAISQALRGSTLLIGLVPMLLLPVLLGGVGWLKAVVTVGIHACAFLVALTAGLVVSSLAERPGRAALGAVLFALVAVMPLNFLLGTTFGVELWPPLFLPVDWLPSVTLPTQARTWLLSLALLLAGALVATAGGLWQAARQVTLFWQEAEDSTHRLRAVVGMWIRIGALAALATQFALLVIVPHSGWAARGAYWLMNLLWLAPLPFLAAAVTVNRLAAMGGATNLSAAKAVRATTHGSGWRFFWLWAAVAGVCPLVASQVMPFNQPPNPLFMVLNAASVASAGLIAGVLAFAWRRRWATGLVWSLVLSAGLTVTALTVVGVAAFWRGENLLRDTNAMADAPLSQLLMSPLLGAAIFLAGMPGLLAEMNVFTGVPADYVDPLARMVMQNSFFLTFIAVATAGLLPRLLARRLRAIAALHASEETRALRRDFCEPLVGRHWFALRQRRRLNTNPIGWLHARQWSARLSGWGWCLAAVITQVPVFLNLRGLSAILAQQAWSIVALQAGMAFAAAGSFQREKLSGVLELILVTPISAQQLVQGRWAALLRQFLPTLVLMALLFGLSVRVLAPRASDVNAFSAVLLAGLPLISLPLIGLYLSLRFRSVLAAWLATCGVGLGISFAALLVSGGVIWVLVQARLLLPDWGWSGRPWAAPEWSVLSLLIVPALLGHYTAARHAWSKLVDGLTSRQLLLP
jgi:ABC-type transport system involved in multi-copper enzyme maturation permease subunit